MVLVNGKPSESIGVSDRGLNYGDGVFETMVYADGHIRFFKDHIDRLKAGCSILGLTAPDAQHIKEDVHRLCADNSASCVIKVLFTRGEGGRGYLASGVEKTNRISSRHDLPSDLEKVRKNGVAVHVCKTRLAIQPALAGVKHLNRLEQVLASSERRESSFDEGLMLSMNDSVVEGTKSNVFWLSDGEYFTPELSKSGVAGVIRAKLIQLLEADNEKVNVGEFPISDVYAADLVFMSNTTMLLAQVVRLEQTSWSKNKLVSQLRKQLTDIK